MDNMYEAALQAQDQQNLLGNSSTLIAAPEAVAAIRKVRMEREMIELHQNIESLLPASQKKVIQFTGSRAGEGVSTIVREYAWMATALLGKSVLIIDAAQKSGGQRQYFGIKNKYGWDDAAREQGTVDAAASRIGESSLYVSCASLPASAASQVHDQGRITDFFERVKVRFDLVLIDSPSHDTAAVTRCMDGVILVVEAERTRWPIVEKAKNKILNNGGTILGMVFNKRQNYIPEFIYTRL